MNNHTPSPSALVLFDIDGTLLRRAGPHHRAALVEAVRRVAGLETTMDHIPVHGMLDHDILTCMMRNAGAADPLIRRSLPAITRRAEWIYARSAPNLSRKTCPGARHALARLKSAGVLFGLVTGNLPRIGWKKMERAGLKDYFRFGAFAGMARDRSGLVRLALRHARGRGWITPRTPVSLVGDAPSDVIAAKSNGIQAIAVHTGISTPEDLRAHAPDVLLATLRSLTLKTLLYS